MPLPIMHPKFKNIHNNFFSRIFVCNKVYYSKALPFGNV